VFCVHVHVKTVMRGGSTATQLSMPDEALFDLLTGGTSVLLSHLACPRHIWGCPETIDNIRMGGKGKSPLWMWLHLCLPFSRSLRCSHCTRSQQYICVFCEFKMDV